MSRGRRMRAGTYQQGAILLVRIWTLCHSKMKDSTGKHYALFVQKHLFILYQTNFKSWQNIFVQTKESSSDKLIRYQTDPDHQHYFSSCIIWKNYATTLVQTSVAESEPVGAGAGVKM